jgi:biopolymer transport protein ExbD
MSPKTLLRLGLSFLFLALATYLPTGYWLNTRIFVPLDYPVSLDTGHLQSPPFEINLSETYYAILGLDFSAGDWDEHVLCNFKTIHLHRQWRVYKLSNDPARPRELWASSEGRVRQDYYPNAFQASPGKYQLEWDIPAPVPCLDTRHPRLRVITASSDYEQAVALTQLFCIYLGGTGLALVVLATARATGLAFSRHATLRMFPDMILRNVTQLRKHSPLVPIHNLPNWGLVGASIWWVVIILFVTSMSARPTQLGLFVAVKGRDPAIEEKSPWPDTLAVVVRTPRRFFVNGEEIERGKLRATLLERLSHRAVWTVYVEAEYDTVYMDTAYAIDTIQGCGAKVIWITPKLREQMTTQPH